MKFTLQSATDGIMAIQGYPRSSISVLLEYLPIHVSDSIIVSYSNPGSVLHRYTANVASDNFCAVCVFYVI